MAPFEGLDVSVVLPTYNESKSLPGLIPRIVRALSDAGLRGEVIVVDDNSPDDTAAVAEQIAREHPVRVLKRITERGLGTAVIAGFEMSRATVCVVMDADGSHPVDALPGMVRMILEDKAELVVGSRHVQGGGSKDWPLFSQLKSRFAASLAVGLTSMTDPTTGFMAVRRSLLERLALDPVGWKIVLETVVKAHPARLAEVPIVFTDREHGESKQSIKVLLQYLSHLYKLYQFRFPGFVEFLKFCVVGGLGVFVDLSIVAALKELISLDLRLCQVFGFSAAVTFNYAINRRFSFKHARELPILSSYVTYVGANLLGLMARMLVIQTLITLTTLERGTGYGYLLLSAIGIALSTLINFVGVKYLAFAPAETRAAASSEPPVAQVTADVANTSRILTICLVGVALGLCAAGTMWKRSSQHDERVNVIMAENIRAGFEGLVHPSVTPGFSGDWAQEALPALGNTPVYPALLALFAPSGHAAWLVLGTFALTLLGLWLALSSAKNGSAAAAVILLSSAPWVVQPFTLLEFEPLVTCLGALGFALVVHARAGNHPRLLGLLGGLCLGLGFATKMWLVLPAWLACLAFFTACAYDRIEDQSSRAAPAWPLVLAGGALGAGSHLIFVALTAPSDLLLWIERVYLAIFSGAGVTGEKLSVNTQPYASAWAYVRWLVRDHGALLAPIILGLPALTRRLDGMRRAWLAASLGALGALVPLSVPVYKEPLYMLPALPFVYLLAGMCVVAPDLAPARSVRINQGAARVSIGCALLLCAGWFVLGVVDRELSATHAALHIGHVLVWTWPSLSLLRTGASTKAIAPAAILSLALTALALGLQV